MYMPKGTGETNKQEEKTMSRMQGDSYRTHTDHELNAYKARLDEKLRGLIDHKEKWIKAGEGWILCEEKNRMTNPNGSWKWNGWEIEAHEFWITVFPAECVSTENGRIRATGWSQVRKVIDNDKAAANEFFMKVAKPLAKDLKTWIPRQIDNKPAFDYEGRKPEAAITIRWEEDEYSFSLVVDGEETMRSKKQEELKEEAARIGAELEETHTP